MEGNLAKRVKESGRIETNPKKIIQIARKSGYIIGKKDVNEGTPVYNEKNCFITVVPRHISFKVYFSIINALSEGKSNFREYHH